MAKILRFPKTGQIVGTKKQQIEAQMIQTLIESGDDAEEARKSVETDPVVTILVYLKCLDGIIQDETIALRRQGLKGFSKEELYEIAEKSTSLDWQSRPAYFWALVQEFTARD